ncbi:ewing's tumor-associated antigen 1 [Anarrhichthys ocellatus]|uniref:ewing's tumor-associated antigen 1 n=1 Tax=Anarrhichthys ocellatus TaxID=433405 RepID=UPI0012EEC031|nr:ewing's tumor-associated antigen 1 homolog [Anarrhichthys ocellatus]
MNRSRRTVDAPVGPTGSPLHTAPSKPNRLRRSFRQTEDVDSPTEFKTPTRIPRSRSRAGGGFSVESPNNDCDFQQDIIWDATSPSPNRHGKRGKNQKPPVVVDISEIVSRIAPKHGRPTVAEPTLQQWIGDSATIPCTPDVRVPRPKKKSPRPNGVDDLLKLAKQFDFNMFRQDEEDVENLHRQSLELLSEDILDLENDDQNNVSLSLPVNYQPAVKADEQLPLDQHMEDDLDFLFDGPTQRLSGNVSQVSSALPSQVKPAPKEASGKPPASSHGPTSGVSTTNAKVTSAKDEFEDDWENDDLLNDSLVLEMTQNPQKFTDPQHCSTQKPPSQIHNHRESPANVVQSVSKGEKDNVRQRTTFKLDSNPSFSFNRIQTHSETVRDSQQSRFPSGHSVSVEAGSRRTGQTSNPAKSDPQKPPFHQRTSVAKYNATASNTSASKNAQSFPVKPATVSSRGEAPAVSEDPSPLFSSDPVWDDPADDDLLCEMCEDVENRLHGAENLSAKQTPPGSHMSNQRASSPLANRNRLPAGRQTFDPKKQTPASLPCASGRPAGSSLTGSSVSNIAAGVQMTDSFRYTQTKNPSASTNGSTWTRGSSRVQSAPRGNPGKDQFTFRKPDKPVSTVTSKVVGSCSAAEIEQKKQQAMERRRQRLQAAQHHRAPT